MINMDELGRLDKRVEILAYADIQEEGSSLTHKELVSVFPDRVWAKIEPLRGRQYYEQFKDKTEDLIKITVRYRNNIDNNMFVRYQNKLYEIKTVIDPYEAHIKLELMCNIKNRGEFEYGDNA